MAKVKLLHAPSDEGAGTIVTEGEITNCVSDTLFYLSVFCFAKSTFLVRGRQRGEPLYQVTINSYQNKKALSDNRTKLFKNFCNHLLSVYRHTRFLLRGIPSLLNKFYKNRSLMQLQRDIHITVLTIGSHRTRLAQSSPYDTTVFFIVFIILFDVFIILLI